MLGSLRGKPSIVLARSPDLLQNPVEPAVSDEEVDEARPGDLGLGDVFGLGEVAGEDLRDLSWAPLRFLGESQGDVGGEVAVLALPRAGDLDLLGRSLNAELRARPGHGFADEPVQLLFDQGVEPSLTPALSACG
jgi:hypothetical protein